MHQSVYPVADTDEHTKISKIFHLSRDNGSRRIFYFQFIPGIRGKLFQAERHPLFFHVDLQNNQFEPVSFFHNLFRISELPVPTHFTDVKKPFKALFKLDKSAIINDTYYFALNP